MLTGKSFTDVTTQHSNGGVMNVPYLRLLSFVTAVIVTLPALAQQAQSSSGRWADSSDPVAKQLIEAERKWAVLECEPSNVVREALAEDFVGTSPSGPIYTKSEALAEGKPEKVRGCKLLSVRVRFYGPDLAIIYGKETSTRTGADG